MRQYVKVYGRYDVYPCFSGSYLADNRLCVFDYYYVAIDTFSVGLKG